MGHAFNAPLQTVKLVTPRTLVRLAYLDISFLVEHVSNVQPQTVRHVTHKLLARPVWQDILS